MLSVADELPPPAIFRLDAQTLIDIGVNFFNIAVLAALLGFILYKPIRKALQNRTDRIQGELEHAAKEMADATELKLLYEEKLQEIDREREEILAQARKTATDAGRRIIDEAKQDADSIKERANASVDAEWQRAQNEMRTAIIDVSAMMSEKFVKLAINKETHDNIFNETMADLEDMTWRG